MDSTKLTPDLPLDAQVARLSSAVLSVLSAIMDSKNPATTPGNPASVPVSIRRMVTIMQSSITERFPSSQRIVTGGLFFLRYVVPCVTAPDGFGITDLSISPTARRGL